MFVESEDQKYGERMGCRTVIQDTGSQIKCLSCQVEDKYFQNIYMHFSHTPPHSELTKTSSDGFLGTGHRTTICIYF